jgi:short-subunit dehydrogenase
VLLSGKTVLLTGATGGIGHAIARQLHGAGARLILTGRRTEVLEPLTRELGAQSLAVDLADRDAVDRLARECADVDVLIANAALPASGPLTTFSQEEIDRALDVNLRAPVVLARVLAERMAARRSGHLVLVSSLSGKTGTSGTSIYSATKFGLRGFGQGLREDMRPFGVGVSVVFPGFISDAGMFADAGVELPRGVGTSTPEDVAGAVASAIERNRGEIDVAPLAMRLGSAFSGLAPATSAWVARRAGSDKIASEMAAGQSDKR